MSHGCSNSGVRVCVGRQRSVIDLDVKRVTRSLALCELQAPAGVLVREGAQDVFGPEGRRLGTRLHKENSSR